jgi:hypothetical protein
MTRGSTLSLLSIMAIACGGSKPPPEQPDGQASIVVIFDKEIGPNAQNLPGNFGYLSRKHGCKVEQQPDSTVSQCKEGVIALVVINNTRVKIGCAALAENECANLLTAIFDEGAKGEEPSR